MKEQSSLDKSSYVFFKGLEHQALTHLCKEEQVLVFIFQGWLLAGIWGFWKILSFLVE